MKKSVTKRPKSYRINKKLSTAQKMVKTKTDGMFSAKSEGTGKYAKRATKPLSRGQSYKLEKQSLRNEELAINSRPAMIRAIGSAVAQNTTPALTSFGAGAGTSLAVKQINSLTSGGANKSGVDNEEELKESENELPGGMVIR